MAPPSGLATAGIADIPVLTSPAGLVAKLSDRDGLVVASWDSELQQGRVHALGVVQTVEKPGSAIVDWRLANFAVTPSPQGRSKWDTMPFFSFDDAVAERYRLMEHFHDVFAGGQPRTAELKLGAPVADQAFANDAVHQADSSVEFRPEHTATRVPQCNRVSPDGTIFSTPARGAYMGNRADPRRWLVCELYVDRVLKAPRTKLFFLDEAVALAAGHRPCQTCRRDCYQTYMAAVQHTHAVRGAQELDQLLNAARKSSYAHVSVGSLPDGTFVALGAADYRLVWRGALHRWAPHGYVDSVALADVEPDTVVVLTPEPSLAALHNGYPVDVHLSVS
ncbi:hypothetical protein [[Mycobacterium] burgundiense]|uniref:Uncharacterized protein n=1 Tax=[Mycobacterium] burgundiense TaxID=3064286 RepID=A0ABM9LLU1_9MYCO|nr:hypothetical protein [Mycolicibacterium sp. MU0053]CAJ1501227.1 hypothetical protein MU0053_001873 [Mycolicibacterium sp. MU0053]